MCLDNLDTYHDYTDIFHIWARSARFWQGEITRSREAGDVSGACSAAAYKGRAIRNMRRCAQVINMLGASI